MSKLINKLLGGNKEKSRNQTVAENRVSDIGAPYLVKHNVHVGFNPSTGKIEGSLEMLNYEIVSIV